MGKLLLWEAIKELFFALAKFLPVAYVLITSAMWTADFLVKIFFK